MSESTYVYTQRNLLESPEYYMYSAFSGVNFLQDHARSRAATGDDLWGRLELQISGMSVAQREEFGSLWRPLVELAVTQLPAASRWQGLLQITESRSGPVAFPAPPEDEPIHTECLLRGIVFALLADVEDASAYEWAETMLKRFEVNKKLYRSYTPKLKRAEESFDNLKNYALLAAALAIAYVPRGNLKLLNGLLKVNDLLSTQQMATAEELLLAVFALESELCFVTELSDSHGIEL